MAAALARIGPWNHRANWCPASAHTNVGQKPHHDACSCGGTSRTPSGSGVSCGAPSAAKSTRNPRRSFCTWRTPAGSYRPAPAPSPLPSACTAPEGTSTVSSVYFPGITSPLHFETSDLPQASSSRSPLGDGTMVGTPGAHVRLVELHAFAVGQGGVRASRSWLWSRTSRRRPGSTSGCILHRDVRATPRGPAAVRIPSRRVWSSPGRRAAPSRGAWAHWCRTRSRTWRSRADPPRARDRRATPSRAPSRRRCAGRRSGRTGRLARCRARDRCRDHLRARRGSRRLPGWRRARGLVRRR